MTQKNMDRLAGETDELPSGWIDVTDELACVSGSLLHAEALRNTQETWGRMPVQLLCGDSYQLPPVPASSSLLAPTTKQTDVVQVHDGANQPVVRPWIHMTDPQTHRLAGETDELPSGWMDVTDELACVSGSLLHAEALRNTQETWGRMPVQLLCGDSYQLPPVPASSSLLAPTTKQTDVVQVHDGANQPVVRLEPVQPHQPHYPPLHPDELFDAWKAWKKERGRA